MTSAQLQARCDYWADRLNLREWHITATFGTAKQMHGDLGNVFWHTEELKATVRISRTVTAKEETLIHELLHVVIQGHAPLTTPYDVNLEKAINRLAAAFMVGNV